MSTRLQMRSVILTLLLAYHLFPSAEILHAHDGPDPLMEWQFRSSQVDGNLLKARLGPPVQLIGTAAFIEDPMGESLRLNGRSQDCVVAEDFEAVSALLPRKDITVSAWVAVDAGEEYGGIVSLVQDNGDAETGWVLGYNRDVFTFGLASKGSDDGNGMMTYIAGKTPHRPGKIFHVVGVYDGQKMQLYVDGKLEAESSEQSGGILYPETAPFVLGAYRDVNEHQRLRGRLRDIAIYDLAARSEWVSHEFEHRKEITLVSAKAVEEPFEFVVEPFLQYGTETGMSVVWQMSHSASCKLFWGEDIGCGTIIEVSDSPEGLIYEARIEGLHAETQYFYRVEAEYESQVLESEVSTFQTACKPGTPVSFVVISDTQDNFPVAKQLSEFAWAQRPHFLLHPGDLVGRGKLNLDWIEEFFPAMQPLISRVPMFPVLGNHEDNAQNYFNYMALPEPEYYYSFKYGDTEFFMIDSNRNVDPGSEQYVWLEKSLAASKSRWKFVCHHHPPYSSDENDYGDLWKTNKSTRGDERVRKLVPLYEQYGVDIVWNGHIHSYERTWPVRENRAVNQDGTIYMITGGGGGSLETPGPFRPFFQNNVRRGHHYTIVHINGSTLELKTYDLNNQLFDSVRIEKK